jgi:hypothetical protein
LTIGWKYQPRNALMFVPDGVDQTAQEIVGRGPQKAISHGNTRLSAEILRRVATGPGSTKSSPAPVRFCFFFCGMSER